MSFGLYVHWPFCESKCPYCDFNSHVAQRIDPDRWVSAFTSEIRRVALECPGEILDTIFIGGGTPSLMRADIVEAIIDTATTVWRCANAVEITMEANPGSVDSSRFREYHLAGVNRVSLGIQSLDDIDLRRLGRKHNRADALAAHDVATRFFDRINLDLIYARQHQTPEAWRKELSEALALGTGHLSLYQLTLEDGTVFSARYADGKLKGLPDEDRAVEMFLMTQEICASAGLPAYEVSNHAKPGEECRHNLIYWTGGRYAGVGPGAHGRVEIAGQRVATEGIRDPAMWLTAVENRQNGGLPNIALDRGEQIHERLLMGLRLDAGIALEALTSDISLDQWQSLDSLVRSGHLERTSRSIRTTPQGRLLLNSVLEALAKDLPLTSNLNITRD